MYTLLRDLIQVLLVAQIVMFFRSKEFNPELCIASISRVSLISFNLEQFLSLF